MDLTPLLAPRSIAVVGATDRPDSYAGNITPRNLERAGFEGPVLGREPESRAGARPDLRAERRQLPEAVDAVVVAIPAPGVPAAIRDSVERGCSGAVVLSAGFGGVEEEPGRALEAELREAALAGNYDLRPEQRQDHLGSGQGRDVGWFDPAFEPGAVAMISQSGNVAVNALGSKRGTRWRAIVSAGNQAVCEGERLAWCDPASSRPSVRSRCFSSPTATGSGSPRRWRAAPSARSGSRC